MLSFSPSYDRDSIPAMMVDDDPPAGYASRMVEAFNQIDELGYVFGTGPSYFRDLATWAMRPASHPLGQAHRSQATAEIYARFRVNRPEAFAAARAPALAYVAAQIATLAGR